MEPRERCWQWFDKIVDEKTRAIKAKCKYCGKRYVVTSSASGTSSMNNHMLRLCLYRPNVGKDSQTKLAFLPSSADDKEGALGKQFRRGRKPLRVGVTVPHFHIPSHRTLTRDCYQFYNEEKQVLKKGFQRSTSKNLSYDSHKGVAIAVSITNCLLEWGLDIVFSITVDNASSNDVTVIEISKQLSNWGTNIIEGQHLHVRCMTHILNLIVQDGLKKIDKFVKKVRQVVKYVKQSSSRVKKFKECCESQLITCKKSVCLDVPTRWNSTYLILETAQYFELAFERYSFYDNDFLDYLRTSSFEDGTNAGVFTSED
ncbi:zinc finger BED domain-containing protein RICESLEEPER 2-like [Capsicum annuum]|uniref:zinc finger BED domain-containing protein RICESLEEPER 2-like n=1 Tax=Capsicum annuum TaxID=4072 RepID=UPI001FB14398|nr:zinc finger BED domain-containing protein RICESLEEPER 2-like [Capsicum annuum]